MIFPAVSTMVCHKAGLKNAWGYDVSAACSGFIFALVAAQQFINSGPIKR